MHGVCFILCQHPAMDSFRFNPSAHRKRTTACCSSMVQSLSGAAILLLSLVSAIRLNDVMLSAASYTSSLAHTWCCTSVPLLFLPHNFKTAFTFWFTYVLVDMWLYVGKNAYKTTQICWQATIIQQQHNEQHGLTIHSQVSQLSTCALCLSLQPTKMWSVISHLPCFTRNCYVLSCDWYTFSVSGGCTDWQTLNHTLLSICINLTSHTV
jgi:hypothetical protein